MGVRGFGFWVALGLALGAPAWAQVLHDFPASPTDGYEPNGCVVMDPAGAL